MKCKIIELKSTLFNHSDLKILQFNNILNFSKLDKLQISAFNSQIFFSALQVASRLKLRLKPGRFDPTGFIFN